MSACLAPVPARPQVESSHEHSSSGAHRCSRRHPRRHRCLRHRPLRRGRPRRHRAGHQRGLRRRGQRGRPGPTTSWRSRTRPQPDLAGRVAVQYRTASGTRPAYAPSTASPGAAPPPGASGSGRRRQQAAARRRRHRRPTIAAATAVFMLLNGTTGGPPAPALCLAAGRDRHGRLRRRRHLVRDAVNTGVTGNVSSASRVAASRHRQQRHRLLRGAPTPTTVRHRPSRRRSRPDPEPGAPSDRRDPGHRRRPRRSPARLSPPRASSPLPTRPAASTASDPDRRHRRRHGPPPGLLRRDLRLGWQSTAPRPPASATRSRSPARSAAFARARPRSPSSRRRRRQARPIPAGRDRRSPSRCPTTAANREAHEGELLPPTGNFTVTNSFNTNSSPRSAWPSAPRRYPADRGGPAGHAGVRPTRCRQRRRAVILDDGASFNFLRSAPSRTSRCRGSPRTIRSGSVRAVHATTEPVILEFRNSTWKFQPPSPVTATGPDVATFEDTRAQPRPAGRRRRPELAHLQRAQLLQHHR